MYSSLTARTANLDPRESTIRWRTPILADTRRRMHHPNPADTRRRMRPPNPSYLWPLHHPRRSNGSSRDSNCQNMPSSHRSNIAESQGARRISPPPSSCEPSLLVSANQSRFLEEDSGETKESMWNSDSHMCDTFLVTHMTLINRLILFKFYDS